MGKSNSNRTTVTVKHGSNSCTYGFRASKSSNNHSNTKTFHGYEGRGGSHTTTHKGGSTYRSVEGKASKK